MKYINTQTIGSAEELEESREHRFGILLAFGSLIFVGTYSALAKGLTEFLSPVTLLLLSESLMALFIMMTLGFMPIIRGILKMDRKTLVVAMIVGVINSAIAPWMWFKGLQATTAVNSSILAGGDVIFMVVLSQWLLKEKISRAQELGALIVLAGILIISLHDDQPIAVHIGDSLVIAAVGTFAVGAILFKKYLSHVSPEIALFVRNITGVATVAIIAGALRYPFIAEIGAFPLQKILLLLAFAFFSRYLHLLFYYESLDRIEATTAALIENAQPLSGIFFAVLILGENVAPHHALGAIFIIVGLMIEQISSSTWAKIRERSLRFKMGKHH